MANICYFELKVWGENDAIKELGDLLAGKGAGAIKNIGQIYDFTFTETSEHEAFGCGNCAWSVMDALVDIPTPSLVSELKRLNLTAEIYSCENAVGFQEHFVFHKGATALHEVREDYKEDYIGEYTVEEIHKIAAREHMTLEEFMKEKVDDDWYEIGGFAPSGEWNWYTYNEIYTFAA